MFDRREGLKLFASSLLLPALEKFSFARTLKPVANSVKPARAVRNKRTIGFLDSVPLVHSASLPRTLVPTIRSLSDGVPIEYVDSATEIFPSP